MKYVSFLALFVVFAILTYFFYLSSFDRFFAFLGVWTYTNTWSKEDWEHVFWQQSLSSGIYQLCFSGFCFDLELARTQQEREHWLMFRTWLGKWSGMLFVFEKPGRYAFWMKNTYIPLDILWLDQEFRVVDVQTAFPCWNENQVRLVDIKSEKKESSQQKVASSWDVGKKTTHRRELSDQHCPSYIPWWFASYVLEINAWVAKSIWLTAWSKMKFQRKSDY